MLQTKVLLFLLSLLVLSSTLLASNSTPQLGAVALTAEEQAWLRAHPVIKLAPDPDFKPIEYFDATGKYRGAAADMVALLEKKLGITITIIHPKNWDEAMEKFKNHDVDVLGAMVKTPHRETFALFTDPLVIVPGGIFSRIGGPTDLTLEDLKDKKVAVVSNYAAHDILKNQYPQIPLQVVPDISTGLAKVSLGMVDVYVENMANATFYSQEAGITNLQLAGHTPFDYRWGIGIRKDWPEFQSILNKGLAAITPEERDGAIKKWIHIEGHKWRPTPAFIFSSVIAVIFFALLLFAYWNFSLRKIVKKRTASLQALSEDLENRVKSRTAELEKEVSERLKSDQAALSSEARFKILFQNLSDAVYIVGVDGQILTANEQATQSSGYSLEELQKMNVTELDAVVTDPKDLSEIHSQIIAKGSLTFETIHKRKDGSQLPVELNVRRIDYNGKPALIGVARDISTRKSAEAERAHMEQQLLHTQKLESLGVLAGGIAHDFNNILMTVLGNANLALLNLSPESPVVDNLRKIEEAAARAADLAKQMLAYSGKGKFLVQSLDINRLIEEMGHMLQVSISKKAVLRYNLGKKTPAIEADATQIRQVIMNLVINASEAIGDRSGVIAITTGWMHCDRNYLKDVWLEEKIPEGSYVYLEVADTGCGMTKEIISKMFDPFFSTKFTGRGLGMAAVMGIVRGHKGAVKVYSEVGKGTTLKILFPASEQPAELVNHTPASRQWKGTGYALLVDDEETVRAIGGEMLRVLGFNVITAVDGREAIEIFKSRNDWQFVLLDLTMPHVDGEQCFRELKLINPAIRVIMSSGYNEQEITQKFAGKGLAGFIQKPYNLTALREVIQKTK